MAELDYLLDAIGAVESGHNPKAIGDRGRAIGEFQMWPIAYQEVQRHFPEFAVIPYERLRTNPQLQRAAAQRYLQVGEQVYGIKDLDRLISFYNAGPKARRGPLINQSYVNRVRERMGNPTLKRFK